MGRMVIALLLLGVSTAFAGDVFNPGASSIGSYPDIDNPVVSGSQPTGKILMVDGISHILQVDAVSKICRAGGC